MSVAKMRILRYIYIKVQGNIGFKIQNFSNIKGNL